ncbi:SAM-dependent methyltransferase [Vibrio nigripulchritudo]|uniref:methyltransferase domain-containing protein n=1 Tax=Vibrio nigripulchritudo TaxID=28173 RepID=UPI00190CBD5D|nr:methyltransferase domain-containing protein [Vibrio nigripulchritudo]BCL72827.1 SAM-dependent methyltransferase [Vibrio nigripulchritudo]BDU34191.1 SAM-dependent methyltransferase [Vibrio nigripulchritudo]
MSDFYLKNELLASYFEKQWLDVFSGNVPNGVLDSDSKNVPVTFAESQFHLQVTQFIHQAVQERISPISMLEVGPAMGRTCYELIQWMPFVTQVTLVEPSELLLSHLEKFLLNGGEYSFPLIKGGANRGKLTVDTTSIANQCAHVDFELLNLPFGVETLESQHDLVVCLNVLDQCESPAEIANALKDAVAPRGALVLSCTYQWNKKHLKNEGEAVDDINEYFDESWEYLDEKELEYKIRINERFSYLFLSHTVIYQRKS